MTAYESLERDLRDIESNIKDLMAQKYKVKGRIRKLKAEDFIRTTGITKADVFHSSAPDLPWMGHVSKLAKYIRDNNITKPYCTWNWNVYLTSDILADRPDPEVFLRYEDLE